MLNMYVLVCFDKQTFLPSVVDNIVYFENFLKALTKVAIIK